LRYAKEIDEKNMGVGGKCSQIGQMRQVDLKAAQHLLNPCQATWVRFLYDYGFWELLSSQHMHLLNQKLRQVK
jgi:hypothetical protein